MTMSETVRKSYIHPVIKLDPSLRNVVKWSDTHILRRCEVKGQETCIFYMNRRNCHFTARNDYLQQTKLRKNI